MSSADEHLQQEVGQRLAQLLFQIALLKAELDTLRERCRVLEGAAAHERDGVPA
jgi:cell division protein FtsB